MTTQRYVGYQRDWKRISKLGGLGFVLVAGGAFGLIFPALYIIIAYFFGVDSMLHHHPWFFTDQLFFHADLGLVAGLFLGVVKYQAVKDAAQLPAPGGYTED
jgi:hypothetical protein